MLGFFFKIVVVFLSIPLTTVYSADSSEQHNTTTSLKVCSDPYLLPFSSRDQNGFENKIAALIAKEMDAVLEYTWFPQRMGFIRNTLNAKQENSSQYKCDLVITAPDNFDFADTTKPYYTSSFVIVYNQAEDLGSITTERDLVHYAKNNPSFRFGILDRGPAQFWMRHHDLLANIAPYVLQSGDPEANTNEQVLEDVAAGKISATVVWGPAAGFFVDKINKEKSINLVMIPIQDRPDIPNMRFSYSISMAVRYGEKAWKKKIQSIIDNNIDAIHAILASYHVPVVSSSSDSN